VNFSRNSAALQAHVSFDISRTTCYVTASVSLRMELFFQITLSKWLLRLLVYLSQIKESETSNASCVTFFFSITFDVICALLLNRRTATWHLFDK